MSWHAFRFLWLCSFFFWFTYRLLPFVLRLQRKKNSVLRLIFHNDRLHSILYLAAESSLSRHSMIDAEMGNYTLTELNGIDDKKKFDINMYVFHKNCRIPHKNQFFHKILFYSFFNSFPLPPHISNAKSILIIIIIIFISYTHANKK